jgi:SAM-dependent methyltransferase
LAGFAGDWRDRWWAEPTLARLEGALGLSAARSLLDVGCGAGHWGQRWARRLPRLEVTAVDREPAFLPQAEARAARLGLGPRYQTALAHGEALPFPDDRFDVVTCQTVLLHAADALQVLAEMVRVCRPGGLLLAAEPDNLVNAAQGHDHAPERTLEESVRLFQFAALAARGKAALGHGDERIGRRLPGLFQALGLDQVQAWQNDQCALLLPPYAGPEQQEHLAQLLGAGPSAVSPAGEREVARRRYLAGGGDEARFAEDWSLVERNRAELVAAVQAGRFSHPGAHAFYLVAGRKPGGAASEPEKLLFVASATQAEWEWKAGAPQRARVVLKGRSTHGPVVSEVRLRFDGDAAPSLAQEVLTLHFAPDRMAAVMGGLQVAPVVVHGRWDAVQPYLVLQCGDLTVMPAAASEAAPPRG